MIPIVIQVLMAYICSLECLKILCDGQVFQQGTIKGKIMNSPLNQRRICVMTGSPDGNHVLDETDRQILSLLQADARMPFAEIGRQVGLSAPSVTERVRRMEEAGIIEGYHAAVNLEKVGLPVKVYIEFTSRDGRTDLVEEFLRVHPSVNESYCISGETDILIRASFASKDEVAPFLQDLSRHGRAVTLFVLAVIRPWWSARVSG